MRLPTPAPPSAITTAAGLPVTVWLPADRPPRGSVLILHGAGSRGENHHDFARAARAAGWAAAVPTLRGHDPAPGDLGGDVLDDLAAVAALLPAGVPLALRGSSMGGYLACVAAEALDAVAVVAICPATEEGLLRGLRRGEFSFRADRPALEAFLETHPLAATVERSGAALLLLHAEGDERVPVASSIDLHRRAGVARSKLVVVPGGHHRSVQHDEELQGVSLRFLDRVARRQG